MNKKNDYGNILNEYNELKKNYDAKKNKQNNLNENVKIENNISINSYICKNSKEKKMIKNFKPSKQTNIQIFNKFIKSSSKLNVTSEKNNNISKIYNHIIDDFNCNNINNTPIYPQGEHVEIMDKINDFSHKNIILSKEQSRNNSFFSENKKIISKHGRNKSYNEKSFLNLTKIPSQGLISSSNLKRFENSSYFTSKNDNFDEFKPRYKVLNHNNINKIVNSSTSDFKKKIENISSKNSSISTKYSKQNLSLKTNKSLKLYAKKKINTNNMSKIEENNDSMCEKTIHKNAINHGKISTNVDTLLYSNKDNYTIEELHFDLVKSFQRSKRMMNKQENHGKKEENFNDQTVVFIDEYEIA